MEEKNHKPNGRAILSDLLAVGGAAAVSSGMGMIEPAAGLIAAGVLAIAYAWLISRGGDAE